MSANKNHPFGILKQFVKPRMPRESCNLCSATLGEDHPHLLDLQLQQVVCSCRPCALLFPDEATGRYKQIPAHVVALAPPDISEQWEELRLPINLAFFYYSSKAGRIVAMYPGPAGATESSLTLESWNKLLAKIPELAEMQPDVQALLVDRTGTRHHHFLVPIDECYRLVGIMRLHWRGLSGGQEVWKELNQFFEKLSANAVQKESNFA